MNLATLTRRATALCCIALLAACGQPESGQSAAEAEVPAQRIPTVLTELDVYAAAVASEARPQADRDRDAGRKPAQILEFMGIEPGMTVLDMFTGGGYYAEIISGVVGENGKVFAHSNQPYLKFVGDEFEARFGDGALTNTEVLMAENNELSLREDSLDAVFMALNYHDLYFSNEENGWFVHDVPRFLAELKKGLKPGGIVAIVDHYGAPGDTSEIAGSVHRIDADVVVADMQAAGFIREASSELLRNPDDDYSVSVFDPAIRGKTDRFVMRFRNPE